MLGEWWAYYATVVGHDPDSLGVYELGDKDKETVYYGSGRIKTRLLDHLNKKETPLARHYRFELFGTEAQCRAREEELLRDYKRIHGKGKLPMYNERIG